MIERISREALAGLLAICMSLLLGGVSPAQTTDVAADVAADGRRPATP